jgi:hypothetical protein
MTVYYAKFKVQILGTGSWAPRGLKNVMEELKSEISTENRGRDHE